MRRLRWLAVLLACARIGVAAESVDGGIAPVVSLRETGYLLGDLLEERLDLQLPAGFEIDAASLPAPGRVAPWLEVRSARLGAERTPGSASLSVTYQIFAEVEQVTRVPIPPFKLRIEAGSQTRLVSVPESSFLLSPALPAALADRDRELEPSPPPAPLPVGPALALLASSLLLALACAGYLLWVHDRLPFLPHAPGPFARLWRRWRRRGRGRLEAAERLDLLRDWHLALNDTAGETVYPSTLPRLFARAPYLLPLQARVEALFSRSWQSFYGETTIDEAATPEIIGLLREAALRERGVPC